MTAPSALVNFRMPLADRAVPHMSQSPDCTPIHEAYCHFDGGRRIAPSWIGGHVPNETIWRLKRGFFR